VARAHPDGRLSPISDRSANICCESECPNFGRYPRTVGNRPHERAGFQRNAHWLEAAKKRMHHNVLAIALANKLARIAWAVLNRERNFEGSRTTAMEPRPA
jgi:hypothetical protein